MSEGGDDVPGITPGEAPGQKAPVAVADKERWATIAIALAMARDWTTHEVANSCPVAAQRAGNRRRVHDV
jgi:hypothetical protein